MAHKISKKKARQLMKEEQERKRKQEQGLPIESKREQKKKAREQKKKSWMQKLRDRGGFKPKRAKRWGEECSLSECSKWEDGLCQYEQREQGCYLDVDT